MADRPEEETSSGGDQLVSNKAGAITIENGLLTQPLFISIG
ncbi:MAG TPA: hypothetical protein VER14_08205 [Phototrophicaceae bacterium]|nr:hypothetical protein [Phototrophicaceae bacterium]